MLFGVVEGAENKAVEVGLAETGQLVYDNGSISVCAGNVAQNSCAKHFPGYADRLHQPNDANKKRPS